MSEEVAKALNLNRKRFWSADLVHFEGLWVFVVQVDEGTNVGLELVDGGVNAALDLFSGEFSEPAFDLIDP